MEVLIVLKDNHLGVCQISIQNLAGPGVGPYCPERQSPRSLLGLRKKPSRARWMSLSPERQSPRSLLGL